MKTITYIFGAVIWLIILPFNLLDYLIFEYPKERMAEKWRKNIREGDRCYFNNMLGNQTEVTVKQHEGDQILIVNSVSSQWMNKKYLYPIKNEN